MTNHIWILEGPQLLENIKNMGPNRFLVCRVSGGLRTFLSDENGTYVFDQNKAVELSVPYLGTKAFAVPAPVVKRTSPITIANQ
jgi:hypothetical protein